MAWKKSEGDRRKQKREEMDLHVDVFTSDDSFEGRLENISGDGLGIESFTCVDPKTDIKVELKIHEKHDLAS